MLAEIVQYTLVTNTQFWWAWSLSAAWLFLKLMMWYTEEQRRQGRRIL